MRTILTCLALVLLTGTLHAQVEPPKAPPVPPVPPGGFPMPPMFPGQKTADFKELINPLIEALKDSDAEVRQSAAGALAAIGKEALDPLLNVLKDKEKDKELRANVAYTLGQMGAQAQDALPTLTKMLKEDDKEVRRRVAFAIHRIVKETSENNPYRFMMPGGIGGGTGVARPGVTTPPVKVPDPGLVPPPPPPPVEKKEK